MNEQKISIVYDELGFFETHGGVSRLFTDVMRELPEDCEWVLTPVCTRNAYLQEQPFGLPRAEGTVHDFICGPLRGHSFPGVSHVYKLLGRLFPSRFPSAELANERSRKRLLAKFDYDIYHTTTPHPAYNTWHKVVGHKPLVVTVVDLIPEILGNDRRVRHFRRQMLNDATHIIAITESTKKDIVRLYNIPEKKISVIYLGYDMKSDEGADVVVDLTARWGLKKNQFVLFVGKRGGYKNFNWMVKALAPLLKEGLKLFCTGVPFGPSECALFHELGVAGRIVQSFVSDAEMKALFRNAAAFIYPSRYEGFGIPILDAFAAGCPVLLSRASCFPEVAADAALYFELDNEADFQRQLRVLLDVNAPFRAELIAKGKDRVKNFSWNKCARETAEVYRMVAGRDIGKKNSQ